MGAQRSTCNLPKTEFHNESEDIFDFAESSGMVEERSDEDKRSPPIDARIFISYHRLSKEADLIPSANTLFVQVVLSTLTGLNRRCAEPNEFRPQTGFPSRFAHFGVRVQFSIFKIITTFSARCLFILSWCQCEIL